MKQGKKKPEKKPERDETGIESPDSVTVGPDNRNNPNGIDGIRALQMIAGGFIALVLVWFILRNILHII